MLLIHSKVVTKEVFATLLVLSRLLNSGEDKELRNKYKEIKKLKSKYYPLEQDISIPGTDQDI
jgi:hypothetical protein